MLVFNTGYKFFCLEVSLKLNQSLLVDLAEMTKWKYLVTINLSKTENDLILMPTRNKCFKSVDQINNFV